MNGSERTRLIRVLGMTGSSFDGEALAALRMAQKLMAEHRIAWAELVTGNTAEPFRDQRENDRLRGENEMLRRAVATLVAKLAAGAGAEEPRRNGADNHQERARWILGLYETHALALSERELEFLETVSGWTGPLTEKQQSWFDNLLARVISRTGQQPPP
jgi:hypothetical protein